MKSICIVGSGMSSTFSALQLLKKGFSVTILSPGKNDKKLFKEHSSFNEVIRDVRTIKFEDILGRDKSNLLLDYDSELFSFPKQRNLISKNESFDTHFWDSNFNNFTHYSANTYGGLARGWGSNIAEFNAEDIREWPINIEDLELYYRQAYEFITPYENPNDKLIDYCIPNYAPKTDGFKRDSLFLDDMLDLSNSNARFGASRLAINNNCTNCGLCLWGCKNNAIFDPSILLDELLKKPNISYVEGTVVELIAKGQKIESIVYRNSDGELEKLKAEKIVLGAGAINSFALLSSALMSNFGLSSVKSAGLLDTLTLKLPLLNFNTKLDPVSYDRIIFNEVTSFIRSETFGVDVQVEFMRLNALNYHPFLNQKPLSGFLNLLVLRYLRERLYASTIFMPDYITKENYLVATKIDDAFKIDYVYDNFSKSLLEGKGISKYLSKLLSRKNLLLLGYGDYQPEIGGGIHYAGTIPMSRTSNTLSTRSDGRSWCFDNLWVVDGANFSSLPSKSLTLTLAANSLRISDGII